MRTLHTLARRLAPLVRTKCVGRPAPRLGRPAVAPALAQPLGDRTYLSAATFTPPTAYPVQGYGPTPLLADLNGDGRADLITPADAGVNLLRGLGDGTFAPATQVATNAGRVNRVAVGDFDNNGIPDLALGVPSPTVLFGTEVHLLLGQADGTFAAPVTVGPASIGAPVAADVNRDGADDLIAINQDGGLDVLLGHGNGTFAPAAAYPLGSSPGVPIIGDVDGNGTPDLVVTGFNTAAVYVLSGRGDGTFAPAVTYPLVDGFAPSGVAIGDLNGDGHPDLAVANPQDEVGDVNLLFGVGDGTFAPATAIPAGGGPAGVAIADFDADGRPDLAVADEADRALALLSGNGDGTFGPATTIAMPNGARNLIAADFNGDLLPDLALGGLYVNAVSVLLNATSVAAVADATGVVPFDANGTVQVTVTRTGSLLPATVDYTTAGGSALAGIDYTGTAGQLSFAAGEDQLTVDIPTLPHPDAPDTQTFQLRLTDPVGLTLANDTATVTIARYDENAPPPTVSVADARVTEGDAGPTLAYFTVSLSAFSPDPVLVQYATADGTATGDDYAPQQGSVLLQPGQRSIDIDIPVLGDTTYEADETFTLTLSDPTGATLAAAASATATIVNDDAPPVLTIGTVSRTEGDVGTTPFAFPVTLSAVSGLPVVISYQTADGDATAADHDYQPTSGTLTIPAGQTSAAITVLVNGDTKVESDEEFTLVAPVQSGATQVGFPFFNATIVNDDAPPQLAVADVSRPATVGTFTSFDFAVTRTGDLTNPSTVHYATADGTATVADGDYRSATGTLTFGPGIATRDVLVQVAANPAKFPTATFTLNLSAATAATVADGVGLGTIAEPAPTAARLTGTPIGTAGSYQAKGNTRDKPFDGSTATFFDAPVASGAWAGLDLGTAAAVTQIRYAPRPGFTRRMVGGRFQASNSPDFTRGVVTLYTIPTAPPAGTLTTVNVTAVAAAYRYVRYIGPDGAYSNVAEAQFYGRPAAKLAGTTFGTAGSYQSKGNTIANATDGKPSTFFDAPTANGNVVGIDLGSAKVATQVRFAPRAGFTRRMLGGTFQASNTADFSRGTVTLATVTTAPPAGSLTTLLLTNTTAYRFYRYVAPAGSYGNVAELEFDG